MFVVLRQEYARSKHAWEPTRPAVVDPERPGRKARAASAGPDARASCGRGARAGSMRYALAVPVQGLVACPFCRELFPVGEAGSCPECGLDLTALSNLPPSHDAEALEPTPP